MRAKRAASTRSFYAIGAAVVAVALGGCSALPLAQSAPTPTPRESSAPSPIEAAPSADATAVTAPTTRPTKEPTLEATLEPTTAPTAAADTVEYTNPDGPESSEATEGAFFKAARKLPTFAGLWSEGTHQYMHVAVTKDIDAAIAKLGPLVPRGMTVYFQLAPYTEHEVCALRDRIINERAKLLEVGIFVNSGGCGNIEMRAEIGMSPLTPETLAYMQDRYPGPADYVSSGVLALGEYEPPDTDVRLWAITPEQESELSTCGQRPFPTSALGQPPIDLSAPGPELDALRGAFDTYAEIFGDLTQHPWLLVEHDEFGATFLAPRAEGYLAETVIAGASGWVPTTLAACEPAALTITSSGQASWMADPAFPAPDATSTELHVLVTEAACSGASTPAGRILPPLASYGSESLTLTVAVRSVGGVASCPGNPSLPVTIVLPEPLGDRALVGANDPYGP